MIIFTVRTHGPYAVKKCYLPCADGTRLPTECKRKVARVKKTGTNKPIHRCVVVRKK